MGPEWDIQVESWRHSSNLESYGIDVGIIQGMQPEALRVRDCEFRSIEWTTEY